MNKNSDNDKYIDTELHAVITPRWMWKLHVGFSYTLLHLGLPTFGLRTMEKLLENVREHTWLYYSLTTKAVTYTVEQKDVERYIALKEEKKRLVEEMAADNKEVIQTLKRNRVDAIIKEMEELRHAT